MARLLWVGAALPAGTVLLATVTNPSAGSFTVSTTVFSAGSQSGLYSVQVPADNPSTPNYDGGRDGDSVTFAVQFGPTFPQSAVFSRGAVQELNLSN